MDCILAAGPKGNGWDTGTPGHLGKGTTSLCCCCPTTAVSNASLSQAQRSKALPEVTDQTPTNFFTPALQTKEKCKYSPCARQA